MQFQKILANYSRRGRGNSNQSALYRTKQWLDKTLILQDKGKHIIYMSSEI